MFTNKTNYNESKRKWTRLKVCFWRVLEMLMAFVGVGRIQGDESQETVPLSSCFEISQTHKLNPSKFKFQIIIWTEFIITQLYCCWYVILRLM